MNSWKKFALLLVISSLSACASTDGELITHDRFTFPNSDVKPVPNDSSVAVDISRTYFIWQTPPLERIHDDVMAQALKDNGGSMLVNIKWVTTTTIYPFPVFIYKYQLHMEATAVTANLFIKSLH